MKIIHFVFLTLVLVTRAEILSLEELLEYEPDIEGCDVAFRDVCVRCSDDHEFVNGICVNLEQEEESILPPELSPCGKELHCGESRRFTTK